MNYFSLFFFISLIFSPLSAFCAFIITYEEYKKHLKKREALKHALQIGLFSFLIFMAMGTLAGFLFSKMI